MLTETLVQYAVKARNTNQTSSSFVSKIPTITEPANGTDSATATWVQELALTTKQPGMLTQNLVKIIPYATASNDNTFSMRVVGWTAQPPVNNAPQLWIPVLLCDVLCTASSTFPGITGYSPSNAELFCDTIAATIPAASPGNQQIISPGTVTANSGIAHIIVDMEGFLKLEVHFSTGSSATDCNALLCRM